VPGSARLRPVKRSDFEPEPPTKPTFENMTELQQLAQLARDWRECSEPYRRMLLRLATKGAALPKDRL
jgi:hypothetical protein